MSTLRDRFEEYWEGERDPLVEPPFQPLLVTEEVAEGVCFASSFANATAIETARGLVLVDTGSFLLATQVFVWLTAWRDAPAHAIVYTHGHVDHVFGVDKWEEHAKRRGAATPLVVAHEAVPARFRRYEKTRGYNGCINSRQFKANVEWPSAYRDPDVTYRDRMALDVGGERIEVVHARGETDDASWVWLPSRKVLCTGDLFLWAAPNAGNPQKVQRYPAEWAVALREMAALGAEVLCPGHGVPIWGADRVRRALTETAELLEHLVRETLARMNQGMPLRELLHEVKAPIALLARPYLTPIYDQPEFVVRNIARLYGGWWDGDPASLEPAPPTVLARELADAAGGAPRLMERAQRLAEAGELALACHLAQLAADASRADAAIWKARGAIFRLRAERAVSLMARGVYAFAADEPPPD
jgi:glyoxylase-like metal-dependent hydrolase (beta-lactamase superfamily II)